MTNSNEQERQKTLLAKLVMPTTMLDEQLALIETYATQRERRAIQAFGEKAIGIIASFEVKSRPSNDPELRYWQGYHQAQLDITTAIQEEMK